MIKKISDPIPNRPSSSFWNCNFPSKRDLSHPANTQNRFWNCSSHYYLFSRPRLLQPLRLNLPFILTSKRQYFDIHSFYCSKVLIFDRIFRLFLGFWGVSRICQYWSVLWGFLNNFSKLPLYRIGAFRNRIQIFILASADSNSRLGSFWAS